VVAGPPVDDALPLADDQEPAPLADAAPLTLALPDGGLLAGLAVTLAQAAAVGRFGPHAEMTDHERQEIEAALGRIVNRLPVGAAAQLGRWADPVALAVAVGGWLLRVYLSAGALGALPGFGAPAATPLDNLMQTPSAPQPPPAPPSNLDVEAGAAAPRPAIAELFPTS
jgi:hypothetical protein